MKVLLLQTIDDQWKDHLLSIDHLKEGIGMRAYGQRNPKEEYKREAYGLFMEMMGRIRQEVVNKLFRVQLAREEEVTRMEEEQRRERNALTRDGRSGAGGAGPGQARCRHRRPQRPVPVRQRQEVQEVLRTVTGAGSGRWRLPGHGAGCRVGFP